MDRRPSHNVDGTRFRIFDVGWQHHRQNLEFEQDKKIVQQWYFEGEPEVSIVTIKLHPHKEGTSAELRHTNIPDSAYDDMIAGWDESYFGALTEFFSL